MDMRVRPLQVERDGRVDHETVRARRLSAKHHACGADVHWPLPGQQVSLQLNATHWLLAGRPGGLNGEAGSGALGKPAVDDLLVCGHHLLGGPLGGLSVGIGGGTGQHRGILSNDLGKSCAHKEWHVIHRSLKFQNMPTSVSETMTRPQSSVKTVMGLYPSSFRVKSRVPGSLPFLLTFV